MRPSTMPRPFNRGNALKHLGRYAEALASYERVLAHAPCHIDAHYSRGNTLYALAGIAKHSPTIRQVLALRT